MARVPADIPLHDVVVVEGDPPLHRALGGTDGGKHPPERHQEVGYAPVHQAWLLLARRGIRDTTVGHHHVDVDDLVAIVETAAATTSQGATETGIAILGEPCVEEREV